MIALIDVLALYTVIIINSIFLLLFLVPILVSQGRGARRWAGESGVSKEVTSDLLQAEGKGTHKNVSMTSHNQTNTCHVGDCTTSRAPQSPCPVHVWHVNQAMHVGLQIGLLLCNLLHLQKTPGLVSTHSSRCLSFDSPSFYTSTSARSVPPGGDMFAPVREPSEHEECWRPGQVLPPINYTMLPQLDLQSINFYRTCTTRLRVT